MVRISLATLASITGAATLVAGKIERMGDHGTFPLSFRGRPTVDGGDSKTLAADSDILPLRPLQPWDISKPLTRKVNIKTNEATWVNVDVSPNGEELVFDVLGDIYTLPISGGKAKPLLTGPAFEIQPQYSADGKHILFTSDRSGVDNLWLSDREGKNLRQVTDESYRFVNNGNLSPKGDSILGVKWYTSGRTIPAGTIQKYNISSLPAKPTKVVSIRLEQVGYEEPAFNPAQPDIFYYSGNVADSGSWQYSKDPHKGIFNIFSQNITSGVKETVTGGVGGAARPTPSRDGKFLAFVRRIEFNWSLVVRELETGNEKIIFENLSRDNQESSASSGVYPRFNWTPDNSAIIIWAKGKLWSVPVNDGKATIIPFEIDAQLDLAETVRHKVDLIKENNVDSFKSTTIKHYDISPNGKKVVFAIAGSTYVKDLTTNKTTKLNLDKAELNRHSPTFHPGNDNIIIQSAWSDLEMSSVEIYDVTSNKLVSVLNLPPGRYDWPALSKDGKQVSLSKLRGDAISGNALYTTKPGVYVVQLNESYQVVESSFKRIIPNENNLARFSEDGTNLKVVGQTSSPYLYNIDTKKRVTVGSIKDSYWGNDVSDDLSQIGFQQYHHVFTSPVPKVNASSFTYWTKPGSQPQGLIRLSQDGGELAQFGPNNSKKLYFVLASTLYEADLELIQSKCSELAAADTEKFGLDCSHPLLKKYNLSVELKTDKPNDRSVFVLDNATVVTMQTGNESKDILKQGRIVVRGNIIEAVGNSWDVKIPPYAKVFNLDGGVVVPGYIDAHAHWDTPQFPVQGHWGQLLQLSYGVTTAHNPSYEDIDQYYEQDFARTGKYLSPRLYGTGNILYGAAGASRVEINSLDDARSALRRHKAYGGFSVKSYNQPARASRQMLLQAARELGLSVVPEGGMNIDWNMNQIIDGHTTLEHNIPTGFLYDDIIQLFAKAGTATTPTLIVSFGGIMGENWWYQNTNVWEEKKLRSFHPLRDLEQASFRKPASDSKEYVHYEVSKSCKDLITKGVLVNAGAHGQRQGLGYHWELGMFEQGNMTAYQVLKTATINPSKSLGLHGVGQIIPGFLADLNIYTKNNNVLRGIKENSKNVDKVVLNGKIFDAQTLNQIYPIFKKAPTTPILNTQKAKSL